MFKSFKRKFKKYRGKAIKRYFKKGYKPKFSRMVKDIAKVKSMLNAEKKNINDVRTGLHIGQVNANNSGVYVADITPSIAQGTTDSTRSGDSVKLCSAYLKFQFIELGSFPGQAKYKIEIIKVIGGPQVTGTMINQYYKIDPISTVIDFNSVRDPDYYGQYKKVYSRVVNFTSQYSSDIVTRSIVCKLRLNHHIRYATNTTTVADGQYIMVITADCGNASGTTASTLANIPAQAINTGFAMNYNFIWYYFDN